MQPRIERSFITKIALLALILIQYACTQNKKDSISQKLADTVRAIDTVLQKTTATQLKAWPTRMYEGEVRKYYSNAKAENLAPDTSLLVFEKYLVLIIRKNNQDAGVIYAVYDFTPGLIDTLQDKITLPAFPRAKCSFTYYNDELIYLQSIQKDKLIFISNPEDIVAALDIYDLNTCKVKKIANENEVIVGEMTVRDDSLYFYKLKDPQAKPVNINDTLYHAEREYVISLNDLKVRKTGKERLSAVNEGE